MVEIIQNLVSSDKYGMKCPYTRTPTRIVIHNTANDAPAVNEIAYMKNNNYEVSYHYAVDDKEIVQGIPLERNAWASGDGRGKGNMEGIHIEICYSLSGGEKYIKAEKNAAELTAYLLNKYGWDIDKITKHQDYDGKYCPHRTLDMGWQRFLDMVKVYMEDEKDMTREETTKMITEELNKRNPIYKYLENIPAWGKPTIEKLVKAGKLKGEGKDESGKTIYNISNDVLRVFVLNDR